MQCPSCQHELREGARFCEQCGAGLEKRCSACNASLSPNARFCSECGAAQESVAAPPTPPRAAEPDEGAERRIVTILFSDLVDSTALSHRLDPEELRDLINRYHEVCAEEIRRYGGYIAQYLGDGILAFFGYPVAHERDAQAAVEAGRGLLQAVARESGASDGSQLSIRVGVHTGLVVAGEVGAGDKRERLAIGSTPNVAARVQSIAAPDTLVISESTWKLAGGFFDCVDLGVQEMKGVDAGMRCFEVRGESGARTTLQSKGGAALSPLVGRDAEVAALAEAWDRARDGEGSVLLVAGEAGLGKSRLLLEQKKRVEGTEHVLLECSCSPFAEHTAFFPITDAIGRLWELGVLEPEQRLERLRSELASHLPDVDDAVPILAPLLGVPLEDESAELDMAPQRRKERTLELLELLLTSFSERAPLLFVVEDLHWMDPSTQELLDHLVGRIADTRMLALLLFRPNYESPWDDAPHVTRVDLTRLAVEETKELIRTITGGLGLPPEVMSEVVERVDGVPLYVEEITKMVIESETLVEVDGRYELRDLGAMPTVPATLQESLMARLDRVASEKEVVQLGAMIGRSFPIALVRVVSGLPGAEIDRELGSLIDAEILHADPVEEGSYVFKHALIQDAAYESILKGKRRASHLRIAEAIESEFPELAEARPELLLHHWGAAGRAAEAIPWAVVAGSRAKERSALVEAQTHLRRGVALLEEVGADDAAKEFELELLLELGPVLVSTLGYSNPEVETVFSRARALCEEAGSEQHRLFAVLSGLLLYHQSRAELSRCVELTHERMEIARKLGDESMEMLCHENFGTLAVWRGELEYANGELAEALSRYTPGGGRAMRLAYGTDVSVISPSYQAQVYLYRGRFDEAHARIGEAVEVGRELGHVGSLALALSFSAGLNAELGEVDVALEFANELHGLATREHLAMWAGSAVVQKVRALTALGDPEGAIAAFFDGTAAVAATGSSIAGRLFAAYLGDAYLAAGRAEEGLGILDGILAGFSQCEDVFYDADLHRIRGSMHRLIAPGEIDVAEGHFREAVRIAQLRENRLLELRAKTELARLLGEDGRAADGRALLSSMLGEIVAEREWLPQRRARAVLETLDA